MNDLVIKNKTKLIELCNKYDVKSMHLIGSAIRNDFKKNSDIDLLVSFKKNISIDRYTDNYFDLHNELENLFNRKVDLITNNSLSNPYLIKSIENTKALLYAR